MMTPFYILNRAARGVGKLDVRLCGEIRTSAGAIGAGAGIAPGWHASRCREYRQGSNAGYNQ